MVWLAILPVLAPAAGLAAMTWGLGWSTLGAPHPGFPLVATAAIGPTALALALAFPARVGAGRGARGAVALAAAVAAAGVLVTSLAGPPLWGIVALTTLATTSLTMLVALAIWAWAAVGRRVPAPARAALRHVALALALGSLYLAVLAAEVRLAGMNAGVATVGAALAVMAALRPASEALRRAGERLLGADRAEAQQALEAFVREPGVDAGAIAAALVGAAARAVRPAWAALWLDGERLAAAGEAPATLPGEASAAVRRALALGDGATGWLALGPPAAGGAYGAADMEALDLLVAHGGAALGRARLEEARVALLVGEQVARAIAAEREALARQLVHDLRTDVFNVVVAADLGRRSGDVETAFAAIADGADRLDAFLAEKAGLVAGQPAGPAARVADVLEGTRRALAPTLAARGQRLTVELAEPAAAAPLSTVQLGQIALNLLANASKFSPDGAELRCAAGGEDGWLTLTVADQGPGLPPGFAPGDRPAAPGHGLGLLNVVALAEAVGGGLSWRNGPDGGAVFEVRLPRAAP